MDSQNNSDFNISDWQIPKEQVGASHYESTWKQFDEFQKGVETLGEKIDMKLVRHYLLTGEKSPQINDEIYAEIDRLNNIRKSCIQDELPFIEAQAKAAKLELPEDIKTGKDIRPFFSESVLKQIPNLDTFTHMMWFTEKELKEITNPEEQKNTNSQAENEPNL